MDFPLPFPAIAPDDDVMKRIASDALPQSRFLDRRTAPHIFTLIMLAGVAALAMNLFLPSMPAMARHFDVDYSVIQLAVSAYLALTGVLQLFIGPLADRYGRRPVLLCAIAVFTLASVGCVLAPNATMFLLFRFIQAIIAAALVLSRAIIRDMVPAEEAAAMIGYVTTFMALMPMLGPVAGGFLEQALGWQANFIVLALSGAALLLVLFFDLMETNPPKSGGFRDQIRSYPELLTSRRFWGYSAIAAFSSGCFFVLLGGGPYVGSEVLGMQPRDTGISFGIISLGYMCGNYLTGRFARTAGLHRMMITGTVFSALGLILALGLMLAGYVNAWTIFGPIFFVGFGNGLTLPSANAGTLSVKPELAGTASGLGGALAIGGGAVLSAVTGFFLGTGQSAFPLILMMLFSATMSILATLYTRRIELQVSASQGSAS